MYRESSLGTDSSIQMLVPLAHKGTGTLLEQSTESTALKHKNKCATALCRLCLAELAPPHIIIIIMASHITHMRVADAFIHGHMVTLRFCCVDSHPHSGTGLMTHTSTDLNHPMYCEETRNKSDVSCMSKWARGNRRTRPSEPGTQLGNHD